MTQLHNSTALPPLGTDRLTLRCSRRLTFWSSCRLKEYRDKVRKNAAAADAEEAKQRLRQATLGVQGPNMDAFLRQLGGTKVLIYYVSALGGAGIAGD